jgi:glycosyltransferase involved in cell wall biosynthesis
VGAGTEFERIKQFSDSMDLQEYVVFTGYADDNRLVDILQVADVAIIPGALWFHAPVKLFQYASNGLPVLSIDTPTIREIASGSDDIRLFDRIEDIDRIMEEVMREKSGKRERSASLINWFEEQYGKQAMSSFFRNMFSATR